MATILKRDNKDGTTTWRVLIRRKGLATFCKSFLSEKEAQIWAFENEEKYINDPNILLHETQNRLNDKRYREFKRKNQRQYDYISRGN